jgi:hypothetical protein
MNQFPAGRPVDEAVAVIPDVARTPVRMPQLTQARQTSEGPLEPGSALLYLGPFLGRSYESPVVCTALTVVPRHRPSVQCRHPVHLGEGPPSLARSRITGHSACHERRIERDRHPGPSRQASFEHVLQRCNRARQRYGRQRRRPVAEEGHVRLFVA